MNDEDFFKLIMEELDKLRYIPDADNMYWLFLSCEVGGEIIIYKEDQELKYKLSLIDVGYPIKTNTLKEFVQNIRCTLSRLCCTFRINILGKRIELIISPAFKDSSTWAIYSLYPGLLDIKFSYIKNPEYNMKKCGECLEEPIIPGGLLLHYCQCCNTSDICDVCFYKTHLVHCDICSKNFCLNSDTCSCVEDSKKTGFVYFIQKSNIEGPVKIGYSVNPESRLKQLQTSHDENLYLLKSIPGNSSLEKQYHGKYQESRINGEWFKSTEELMVDIGGEIKTMYFENIALKENAISFRDEKGREITIKRPNGKISIEFPEKKIFLDKARIKLLINSLEVAMQNE